MAKSSREHIAACLMELRRMFGPTKMTQEQMTLQDGLYIKALGDIEPQLLRRACDRLLRDSDKWPLPKHILQVAHDIAERDEDQRKLRAPQTDGDLGAIMRNEAILLLGMFIPKAKDYLEDDSRSWVDFIAEAGRVWSKVRPADGLAEVDRLQQRARYGFALEAWARWYLRAEPVSWIYATTSVREIHRLMTGRDVDAGQGNAPDPGPLAAAMAKVVELRTVE